MIGFVSDFLFFKASFQVMATKISIGILSRKARLFSLLVIAPFLSNFVGCRSPSSVFYNLKYSFPQTFLLRSLCRFGKGRFTVCLNLMCLSIRNTELFRWILCLCIFITLSKNTVSLSDISAVNSILWWCKFHWSLPVLRKLRCLV